MTGADGESVMLDGEGLVDEDEDGDPDENE
jgi:hypothetical protein